ncbi:MAG: hypothetical protein JNG88_08140 [Phycisphaerales bacterium]|nr:hypothetical protein [Phycisphaerales bacterium]
MLDYTLALDFGDDYRWVAGIIFALLALFGHVFQGKKKEPQQRPQSRTNGADADDAPVIIQRRPPPRPPRPSRPAPTSDDRPIPLPPHQPPEPARTRIQTEPIARPASRPQPAAPPARPPQRPAPRGVPVEVSVEYEDAPVLATSARARPIEFPGAEASVSAAAFDKAPPARQAGVGPRGPTRQMQSILRLLGNATATRSAVVMTEILSPPLALRESHLDR